MDDTRRYLGRGVLIARVQSLYKHRCSRESCSQHAMHPNMVRSMPSAQAVSIPSPLGIPVIVVPAASA